MHGILLIALFSCAAFYIAEIPVVRRLSFSPLIVGIILGMLYANSLRNRLPETWVPGIKLCTKQILRAGIVLYGFRLTLHQVVAVGLSAVVIDTIIGGGTLFLGVWLGRLLRLDKDTTLLTSTGSAICGAAAVLGAEPIVKGEGHKTAIAVSTVVIFGTISMSFTRFFTGRGCWMPWGTRERLFTRVPRCTRWRTWRVPVMPWTRRTGWGLPGRQPSRR